MMNISYLEEKLLTRKAFQLFIEQQQDCKVVYSGGLLEDFGKQLAKQNIQPDLCIIADCYPYLEILKTIKQIKLWSSSTYILLKSDATHMKGICFLLKNGLHGIFFTDEPLLNLKECLQQKTRFKLSLDKTKIISANKWGKIEVKELNYNTQPLTQNEIQFIQACAKDQSYEEIANSLQKSINTIYGYRDRVFKKLQVKQRTAMVMTALKRNYIDL